MSLDELKTHYWNGDLDDLSTLDLYEAEALLNTCLAYFEGLERTLVDAEANERDVQLRIKDSVKDLLIHRNIFIQTWH
ncbi:hypothetical protein [Siphonobacter sp. SORGH_AS_0500]|uniref:hypothetical protein n=1 Tax=Siphonobacter sp. SORGH_AS_0500 TaxID=1864824 RepID=UPI00286543EF|nr:hypothetical protein [Siphonobacter sp. SORGH_AS_0500]MDR6195201.1 hypothetical protein [Siphonobacter sp. SORGH_AS_0500]